MHQNTANPAEAFYTRPLGGIPHPARVATCSRRIWSVSGSVRPIQIEPGATAGCRVRRCLWVLQCTSGVVPAMSHMRWMRQRNCCDRTNRTGRARANWPHGSWVDRTSDSSPLPPRAIEPRSQAAQGIADSRLPTPQTEAKPSSIAPNRGQTHLRRWELQRMMRNTVIRRCVDAELAESGMYHLRRLGSLPLSRRSRAFNPRHRHLCRARGAW